MNWKRTFAAAAVVCGILSVIGMGAGWFFLNFWHRFEPAPQPHAPTITEEIQAHGLIPEVAGSVRTLSLPETTCFVWVAEKAGGQRVLAAAPKELEGESHAELLGSLRGRQCQAEWTTVKAPDGTEYFVGDAYKNQTYPGRVGAPLYLSGLAAAALAWLALAAWIYLDARDRGSVAAPGWALLGLFAAPLALAVWLISRRTQSQEEEAKADLVCPGCGADTARDAAFCVRCGYALRPACPQCRRLVQADWSYCAACGEDLSE